MAQHADVTPLVHFQWSVLDTAGGTTTAHVAVSLQGTPPLKPLFTTIIVITLFLTTQGQAGTLVVRPVMVECPFKISAALTLSARHSDIFTASRGSFGGGSTPGGLKFSEQKKMLYLWKGKQLTTFHFTFFPILI